MPNWYDLAFINHIDQNVDSFKNIGRPHWGECKMG